MITKLTRTGHGLAVVLDQPMLDELGLDENADVEVSMNGQVIVITPTPSAARQEAFRNAADKINGKYAGLFKRLSE